MRLMFIRRKCLGEGALWYFCFFSDSFEDAFGSRLEHQHLLADLQAWINKEVASPGYPDRRGHELCFSVD